MNIERRLTPGLVDLSGGDSWVSAGHGAHHGHQLVPPGVRRLRFTDAHDVAGVSRLESTDAHKMP